MGQYGIVPPPCRLGIGVALINGKDILEQMRFTTTTTTTTTTITTTTTTLSKCAYDPPIPPIYTNAEQAQGKFATYGLAARPQR